MGKEYTDLKVIKKVLEYRNYRKNFRSDYDDGIQEGLIRAWRDQVEGTYEPAHVINRADQWALSFWMNPDHYFGADYTGKQQPHFHAKGNEIRQKILEFSKKFRCEEKREPSATEISEAIGVPRKNVYGYLKTIRENSFVSKKANEETIPTFQPLDTNKDQVTYNPEYRWYFEKDLIARLDMLSLIGQLNPTYQEVIYLTYYNDWTQRVVAEHMNVSQGQVTYLLKYAREELRLLMEQQYA